MLIDNFYATRFTPHKSIRPSAFHRPLSYLIGLNQGGDILLLTDIRQKKNGKDKTRIRTDGERAARWTIYVRILSKRILCFYCMLL